MRSSILLVLFFSSACASAAPASDRPRERTGDPVAESALADRFMDGRVTHIRPDVVRIENDITGPPAAVWEALNQVFATLDIEVASRDEATLSLANPAVRVFRRLGGERLSTWLDCGRGMTGPFADRYRVHMNIFSQVRPATDGTSILETTIEASGRNPDGTSDNRHVACGSTHRLEARIATEVAEIVGGD